MKKVSYSIPSVEFREDEITRNSGGFIRRLINILEDMRLTVSSVVNFNAVTEVSQNAMPTPLPGQMLVWHDADAASGQPTHYIVYNMGGTVRTFRSVEQVP